MFSRKFSVILGNVFFFQVTAEWLSHRPLQIYVHLSVILPTKLNESDDSGIKFDDE